MSFFNNLTKKVSEAGQKTIAKTRDFADTAKFNSMISDEERTIKDAYCKIGEMYVALHRDDYGDEFSQMISTIEISEQKIEQYKKLIAEIKGIQTCEKCGAEVPAGAAFCSSCGAPMKTEDPEAKEPVVFCTSCGAKMPAGIKFCTACGHPMDLQPPYADLVEPGEEKSEMVQETASDESGGSEAEDCPK